MPTSPGSEAPVRMRPVSCSLNTCRAKSMVEEFVFSCCLSDVVALDAGETSSGGDSIKAGLGVKVVYEALCCRGPFRRGDLLVLVSHL